MEHEYVRAAEEDQRRKKEKFEHYYERYSNHLNSLEVAHWKSNVVHNLASFPGAQPGNEAMHNRDVECVLCAR